MNPNVLWHVYLSVCRSAPNPENLRVTPQLDTSCQIVKPSHLGNAQRPLIVLLGVSGMSQVIMEEWQGQGFHLKMFFASPSLYESLHP